jgi:hypothetical protein
LITGCLVDLVAVMGDVFILVYNFHVPLALKVGCPSSGAGCDMALVFIFLCVGLMAICCGVAFFSWFSFYWCVFCCFSVVVWCFSAETCSSISSSSSSSSSSKKLTYDSDVA